MVSQMTPQMLAQQQQYMQAQAANQSMVSGSSMASSNMPVHVDVNYARQYHEEVQGMFMSNEFKASDLKDKKDLVGNTIYKHVEKIVGEAKAPKITGMLIDLPEVELNFSVSKWVNFEAKVMSAFQLITNSESNNLAPGGAQGSPEASQKLSNH